MAAAVDPVWGMSAVTLSDTTVWDGVRGFHVNTGGTLRIEPDGINGQGQGSTVDLVLTAGQYYPYRVRRFYSTGAVGPPVVVALR